MYASPKINENDNTDRFHVFCSKPVNLLKAIIIIKKKNPKKNKVCSIFITLFCFRKMWESSLYLRHVTVHWQYYVWRGKTTHEWFLRYLLVFHGHPPGSTTQAEAVKFPNGFVFCPKAPVHPLGKITTLQKLCPLIHPLQDSLCRPVTQNKPGLAATFRSLQQYSLFIWDRNWSSAAKKMLCHLEAEAYLSITAPQLPVMTHSIRSKTFLWEPGSAVKVFCRFIFMIQSDDIKKKNRTVVLFRSWIKTRVWSLCVFFQ